MLFPNFANPTRDLNIPLFGTLSETLLEGELNLAALRGSSASAASASSPDPHSTPAHEVGLLADLCLCQPVSVIRIFSLANCFNLISFPFFNTQRELE